VTTCGAAQWFVVHTHAHSECKAAAHLARQGFDFYLPQYLKRRRHARRVQMIATPLFPRYVFVAIDLMVQRWRSIQSTVGVNHLICRGDDPVPVPGGVVDGLRSRENDRGFIHLDQRPRFAAGEKVRVVDGAFSACLGLYEGMADKERVAILIDLLGRKVRVVLDGDWVAAA
jgi:transcriptional antiterminator RfaH